VSVQISPPTAPSQGGGPIGVCAPFARDATRRPGQARPRPVLSPRCHTTSSPTSGSRPATSAWLASCSATHAPRPLAGPRSPHSASTCSDPDGPSRLRSGDSRSPAGSPQGPHRIRPDGSSSWSGGSTPRPTLDTGIGSRNNSPTPRASHRRGGRNHQREGGAILRPQGGRNRLPRN
jgi:hypothetical protein